MLETQNGGGWGEGKTIRTSKTKRRDSVQQFLPLGKVSGPAEQLSRATGREVGRSLEKEFGSLKPWSVGEGVEHCEWGACSEGGEGEAEGAPPPIW